MADTAVTINTLVSFDTEIEKANTAATVDTANGTEVFAITPTKAGKKLVIGLTNAPTVAAGALAYSIAAGDLWAASAAKTGSVAHGKEEILQIDTGKYLGSDGIIQITLTPASGKKLKTDHTAAVYAIEVV